MATATHTCTAAQRPPDTPTHPLPSQLQAKLPAGLTVDNYRGTALLSVVALSENGIEPVCPLAILAWLLQPLRGSHHSVSVRTYVRPTSGDGPPGLYFFSLDCSAWLPSVLARLFLNLPYRLARMKRSCVMDSTTSSASNFGVDGAPQFEMESDRCKRTLLRHEPRMYFRAVWEPASRAGPAEPGSLDEFVVERYFPPPSSPPSSFCSPLEPPEIQPFSPSRALLPPRRARIA